LKDSGLEIAKIAYQIAEDRKAWQPIVLDVSKQTSICSYIMVVSHKVKAQVRSLAMMIQKELAEKGYEIHGKEGLKANEWILLDYGEALINVMHQPERDFYLLEEVWRKAPEVEFD
jgi:ribosome-associated protein